MPDDHTKTEPHGSRRTRKTPVAISSGKGGMAILGAVAEKGTELRSEAITFLKKAGRAAGGDDPDHIEAECAYLAAIIRPGHAVVPNHAIQAFAAAGLAAGLLTFEEPIMRFTRGHMDIDSGVFQRLWRSVFPETDVTRAVNTFMDHVPGWNVAGGTYHRIHHGHDLEALVSIMRDHNAEGALQWLNHVTLRDFWTPHGVPFLPSGSSTLYEWLVNAGFNKATAANLLTINAAELFAGLSALRVGMLVYHAIKTHSKNKAIKHHLVEGDRRAEAGNADGATESYMKAHAISGSDAKVGLGVAMRLMAAAPEAEDDTANELYRNAYSLSCGILKGSHTTGTDTVEFQGGTLVSIRGLAGYVLVAGLRGDPGNEPTKRLPNALLKDSISAFRGTARALRTHPRLVGTRNISAALNDLLALELSTHLGETPGPNSPLTIRHDLMAALYPASDPRNPTGNLFDRLIRGVEGRYPLTENWAA